MSERAVVGHHPVEPVEQALDGVRARRRGRRRPTATSSVAGMARKRVVGQRRGDVGEVARPSAVSAERAARRGRRAGRGARRAAGAAGRPGGAAAGTRGAGAGRVARPRQGIASAATRPRPRSGAPAHAGQRAGCAGPDPQPQHLVARVQRVDAPAVHQPLQHRPDARERAVGDDPRAGARRSAARPPGRRGRRRRRTRRTARRRRCGGSAAPTRAEATIWASERRSRGRSARAAMAPTTRSSTGPPRSPRRSRRRAA